MLSKQFLALSSFLVGSWVQNAAGVMVPTEAPSSTLKETVTDTATGTGVTTHTINVGAAGHKFTPNDIKASVGDILEYRFYPDAHWVIRGDFNNPCIPYEYVDVDRIGFSSGPQPVKAITNDAPRYRVRVNNTEPIFYYCGASGSCVRYHMMGVVNPSKNETLDGWLKNADGVDIQLRPGDPFPKESGFATSTTSATAELTTSTTATTSTSTESNDHSSHYPSNGNSLSSGAIAGIVIGSVVVFALMAGGIYLCGRRGGFEKAYRKTFNNKPMLVYPNGAPPVTEVEPGSPNNAVQGFWVYKPTSPIASSSGQSRRTSPPLSPSLNFPYDGRMMSQDRSSWNANYIPKFNEMTLGPPPRPPKEELVVSAELPGQKLAEPAAELPDSVNQGK